jgi:ligand-binding sensor domain-containing protein
MRAWVVSLGVVIPLIAAQRAYALDSHRGVTQYAQTHYETRDGLAHGLANSIAQTADGYLWTGSEEGLSRFDGASFTTFDHRKTEGIPGNVFTALAVDLAGTLWAATRDHGVLHLVDGEFRAVAWEAGPQEQQVRALAFDAGGDLWVGLHDRGLVRLRAGALVTRLASRDGLPCDDVRAFLAARDGTMWIGTFRGAAQWKAGRLARGPAELDGTAIHAIAQDGRGELWFATARGLAHLRGDPSGAGTIEWVGGDRLSTSDVRQVLFDRDGNLWIGSAIGVARMTPGRQIDLLLRPAAIVLALFEDAEGNLWIGSEGGLDRLRDGDVLPFGAAEGLTDEPAFGVREDAAGAMWITTSGGLFRIAPGETRATRLVADRGTMYALYPDARGDVWFGGRAGEVGRWHDGKIAWLGTESWERIRSIAQTGADMWLGTEHGLFRMRGDRLADAEPIVPGVAVSAIAADAGGALWLATEGGGLMRWRAGAPAPIPAGGPPRNAAATTFLFDADGTMWVGTQGAGLWRLRDERWFVFTAKDGMFDDLVWRILDDGLDNLWMSSNRGIWRVSRTQLEARAEGLRATVDSVLYGEADGMPNRECNGAIDPAGWRTRDGRLWFPTVKGVVAIDPAHLRPTQPPTALVESARIDGQPQRLAGALVLAPGAGRLELAYTAPVLRGPERLRFRYRLDGFDRAWNDAGAQRLAQYTNLSPGDYRFMVQAGLDGAWGKAGTLAVTLRPEIYQTGWFYALAIVSIALVIVAVPMLRVRQLRAHARELDQRVQEAARELKVLSGLLPICAWCKKVRDDRGYWSQIEAYLSARTDTQITHGICPDCNDKLMADDGLASRPR